MPKRKKRGGARPGAGRPRKPKLHVKSVVVSFWITPEEARSPKKKAKKARQPLSEWWRDQVLK